MKKNKIFVSHSSKDIPLVKLFVEQILKLGIGIPSERIFCTSMEGHGVKSGEYIPDRLRDEIRKSCLAILFVSKNYKTSEICLNEMGAAWATLKKENVVLLLLPDTAFDEIGFLNLNKLGLRIDSKKELYRLIQDKKTVLDGSNNIELISHHIDVFLKEFKNKHSVTLQSQPAPEYVERNRCFAQTLESFDQIIRKFIPALNNGVHEVKDTKTQNGILQELSKAGFLKILWYMFSGGDCDIGKMKQLASGNWLISDFNWEVKIGRMFVSKNLEYSNEFILLQSEKLDPFQITSDVGGKAFNVGILSDGTIVSENERCNGYAIINGESVALHEHGIDMRGRERANNWVFFATEYHKAGFSSDKTIEFCRKLDKGEVEVTDENITRFLRKLENHPTVKMWR